MLQLGKRLWKTLTKGQQRRVLLLSGAVIIMAVLEVINVSAIAPFLALASEPTMIQDNAVLAYLYDFFDFDSVNGFLIAVGLGVFTLMLLSNAWSALTTWAQLRLVWSLNHQLSAQMLERYLHRPYTYFLSRNTADLSKNLLSEVQQITSNMIQPTVLALGKVVVALGIIFVLIAVNPWLAVLVTVVVGGSYGLIYSLTRKRLNAIGRDRVNANEERFTVAGEAFGGIKEVKVLNAENAFLERFQGPSYRFSRHQASRQTISSVPRYAIETVAFGTVILIVVYLLAFEHDFGAIVPTLGMYAFAGYRLMPALQQIFQAVTAIRFYGSALESILDDLAMDQEALVVRETIGTKSFTLQRSLKLENITFTYPTGNRPAVNDVSLTIPVNSTVGFVGATGSGKTTLADIILGLLRPQSGKMLVDGVVITDDNLSAWHHNLGYVPQSIFLSDASVSENIAFGIPRDKIDLRAVREAARIAQLDDFVMRELAEQYDTVVGERGVRLSGGQRQRIGIARALYRNPDVIVFDEATSALDNATENYVIEALGSLQGKKTIIMIAHRLTTLEDCEMLYVVDDGVVVRQGTYDDLFSDSTAVFVSER